MRRPPKLRSLPIAAAFVAVAVSAAVPAQRPEAPLPGARPAPTPPDPCGDLLSHPILTLTLEPAVIYPDDRVTLRWEVRNRRAGLAWTAPVHLSRPFRVDPIVRDPAPSSGSRTWTAQRSIRGGTFALETLCGRTSLEYAVEATPLVFRVRPESAPVGASVAIHGDHFGPARPGSEVRFSIDRRTFPLTVTAWAPQRVDVRLPALPAGDGFLVVSKGGRLDSLPASFHSAGIGVEPPTAYPGLPTPRPFDPAFHFPSVPTPTRTPGRR